MEYIITTKNKKHYMSFDTAGRATKVTNKLKAAKFSSEAKAKNILKNNLSKIEREKWTCIPLESQEIVKPKVEISQDIQNVFDSIQGLQNQIANEINKLLSQKSQLEELQSQIDKEVSDIYHFIAFEKVSVCKWVKIYKILLEKLRERAKIKHQYRILQTIISDVELEIICKIGKDEYKKHFVRLNEYTSYVVEDLCGADVSTYHYEVIYQPKMIIPFEIKEGE